MIKIIEEILYKELEPQAKISLLAHVIKHPYNPALFEQIQREIDNYLQAPSCDLSLGLFEQIFRSRASNGDVNRFLEWLTRLRRQGVPSLTHYHSEDKLLVELYILFYQQSC